MLCLKWTVDLLSSFFAVEAIQKEATEEST